MNYENESKVFFVTFDRSCKLIRASYCVAMALLAVAKLSQLHTYVRESIN